jgi:hypothetical protein
VRQIFQLDSKLVRDSGWRLRVNLGIMPNVSGVEAKSISRPTRVISVIVELPTISFIVELNHEQL